MKRFALSTRKSTSDRMLEIAFLAFTAALFSAPLSAAQTMQKGISVQLASTTGAASLPEAANSDAWIVTVTEQGTLYFGVDPVTPEGLVEAMKAHPRIHGQNLYIKADARVPFTCVNRVLEAAHANLFNSAFLLTGQPTGLPAGTIIPPKGLPIWLAAQSPSVVVHVSSGQGSPRLTINNEVVPIKGLEHKLGLLLQNQSDRVVVLEVEQVPFADVAHVVDVCNMAGAKTVVETPRL
jgi:biopolymer transport protein ExbD